MRLTKPLFLVAAFLPLLAETTSADQAKPNYATQSDIAYGRHDAQRLDVHAPTQTVKDAPVMVYVHGGGWIHGDKAAVAQKPSHFAAAGWVFVSVNYRLLPDGRHPANAQDVAAAVAWVHENIQQHGGSPDEIFIMGHSAGCHLVSLIATDERHLEKAGKPLAVIKGVIALDTQAYDIPKLLRTPAAASLYTKVFSDDQETQQDASPFHHIAGDQDIPPFLICYSRGMTARVNPYRSRQGDAFAAALKKSGVTAQIVDATDRNHRQINQRFGDPTDDRVTGHAMTFLETIRTPRTMPPTGGNARHRQ